MWALGFDRGGVGDAGWNIMPPNVLNKHKGWSLAPMATQEWIMPKGPDRRERASHVRASTVRLQGEPRSLLRPTASVEDAQRAATLLNTGIVQTTTESQFRGVNGTKLVVNVHPEDALEGVKAIVKEVKQGGVQEVLAARIADALGIGHMLPATAQTRDGAALIEFIDGTTLGSAGVKDAYDLELRLRDTYRAAFPELSTAEVTRRARVDRQLVQAFDYIIANRDRHGSNAMVSADGTRIALIDHGIIGSTKADPLVPEVRTYLANGVGVERHGSLVRHTVTPEVREILAAADKDAIVAAFADAAPIMDAAPTVGAYGVKLTTADADGVLARIAKIVDDGWFMVRAVR